MTDREIVKMALGLNMFVFGGYVRDVIVCHKRTFHDIDICCPTGSDPMDLIRIMQTRWHVNHVRKLPPQQYGHMSRGVELVYKCLVDKKIEVDIVVFDGSFDAWRREHSTDFTCNLFYQSRDTYLGIRYIPKMFRHYANPMNELVKLTRQGIFYRIWNGDTHSHVVLITRRARSLVERGMTFRGFLLSHLMESSLFGHPNMRVICRINKNIIYDIQNGRSIETLKACLKELNLDVPKNITDRLQSDLQESH